MQVIATAEELGTGTRPVQLRRFQQFQAAYTGGTLLAREVPGGMLVLEPDYSLALYEPGEAGPVGPCNDARMRSVEILPTGEAVMARIRAVLETPHA